MKDNSEYMSELMQTVLNVRFSDLELERKSCEELLNLAEQNGSSFGIAFSYLYLGDYYLAQNDTAKSGRYLMWARKLCKEHNYEALYMKACHLSGFYYHLIYDEQNALEYYLNAISIAEKLNDTHQICNAWNNIADMFQSRGALEDAREYYLKAYKTICEHKLSDNRILLMLLYNLAELDGFSKGADAMGKYIAVGKGRKVQTEEDKALKKMFTLSSCCVQAALKKDHNTALKIAKQVLVFDEQGIVEKYLSTELLLPIAHALVKLGEAEYSRIFIERLTNYASFNEINFTQRLLQLKVTYAQAFEPADVLNEYYREYYQGMQAIISSERNVRISGMKAKINLHDVILKQQSTQEENERLEFAVNTDALVGIYNRRYFDLCMQQTDFCKKHKSFGIIMLDIDYFKEYNDTYGHMNGDKVLREVGSVLKAEASENVYPCRYGGDEFCCLCYNLTGKDIEAYITKVFERIAQLNIEHKKSKCIGRISLSAGYNNLRVNTEFSAYNALHNSDHALYKAKETGRNRWAGK